MIASVDNAGESSRAANPRSRDNSSRMPRQDELPIQPRPTIFFRFVKVASWVAAHVLFSLRVTGRRELKRFRKSLPKETPIIYVANHLSGVDGLLLGSVIPTRPRIHVLAAGETLTNSPVKWWFVKHVGGVFPVDRSAQPGKAVDFGAVYSALRRPDPINLLIFPEGRCGAVEGVFNHEPRAGAVRFAQNTNAVEIPIGITGTSRLWFRRRIRINVGPPIEYPAGMSTADRLAIQTASIEQLIEPYHAAIGPKVMQWAFPQTRKRRAHWKATRDATRKSWNAERIVPNYYQDDPDLLGRATPIKKVHNAWTDLISAPTGTVAREVRAHDRARAGWHRFNATRGLSG